MNRLYSILLLTLSYSMSYAQTKTLADDKINSTFYLYYDYAGLGGNTGTSQPTVRIFNQQLIYTYEVNSYFTKRDFDIDTISSTSIKQSSIDSILKLVTPFMGKTIEKSNYCLMSGGIHFLTIALNSDTVKFQMDNTLEATAFEVIKIVNSYLPKGQPLCTVEEYENYIRMEENCRQRFNKK